MRSMSEKLLAAQMANINMEVCFTNVLENMKNVTRKSCIYLPKLVPYNKVT